MTTEVVRCVCQPGRIPNDSTSEAGQALKDGLNTLLEQKGFQRLYFGMEVENPDVFRIFIDWDSVQSHKDFMNSEVYKPFTERFNFVLDMSKLVFYHTTFTPHPAQAALSDLSSPVTEIVTAFFPASYSSDDVKTFDTNIPKLIKAVEDNAGTYHGSAGGWADEDLPIPESEEDGEMGKVYTLVIGWDSVQAHLDFRTTQVFKDNIHNLRGAKDLKHIYVVHASLKEITRGGSVGDDADVSVQEEVLNPQAGGGKDSSVKTRADGTTTKNDGGTTNALKKERQGRA